MADPHAAPTGRPRGRPPTYPRPADRLLVAAIDLFGRRGIRATSTAELAAAADTTTQALYRAYGNKDGLVSAAVNDWDRRWCAHLADTLARSSGGPRDRLLRVFDVVGQALVDDDYKVPLVERAAIEFPAPQHPARAAAQAHYRTLHRLFRDLFAEAEATDPDDAAEQWIVLLQGAISTAVQLRSAKPFSAARTAAMALATALIG